MDSSDKQVVLYLPLEGGVGQEFRHQEIVKIGEYADELSPGGGAIIVLKINSNGGLVAESIKINDTIRDIRVAGTGGLVDSQSHLRRLQHRHGVRRNRLQPTGHRWFRDHRAWYGLG